MMTTCLLAAALALAPDPEAALESKLPEIFAKSAAHYKALDAAATPLREGKRKSENGKSEEVELRVPHGFNRKTKSLDMRSIYWWTSGHFPGSLWYLYEATGDDFFKRRALDWTELLAPNSKVTDNHDVGFIMYCSYGNAARLLKDEKYDPLLVETANSLCRRYNEKLGLLRSWGNLSNENEFVVIPDNLMNLELLQFAAGVPGCTRFNEVAISHADVTMKHHFRPDGGCRHVLDYDQATGRVKAIYNGQGASCETAWSRGQAWAIYGYTMMYRTTGYVRYLAFAKKLADYAIGHPNMPADGIPYWDFGAPGEERDSSAGAIMASALLELSQYVGEEDRPRYRGFAVKQLLALASSDYFSEGDEIGHFLLKHGVGHKPGKSEIDTPLDYGDYYFLEALNRFRRLKAREAQVESVFRDAGCAEGVRALPAKATLPPDEFAVRSHHANSSGTISDDARKLAERALVEPIPDTPDELYYEFWTTGNRTHYQDRYFARVKNLSVLVAVEAKEGEGRCLARIEEYLAAICAMKSWVLPAHDWPDGGKGTIHNVALNTDLFSTEVGARLACVVRLIGDRLRPETVAMVKREVERRVFAPVRREAPSRLFKDTAVDFIGGPNTWWYLWWANGLNNWNAVCWDNVVAAACGLLDDPADRAFFIAAADRANESYLANGFEADGYCSEGMGYWNYGFGHHLMTGRLLNRITNGKYGFFRRPKERLAAAYARAYTLSEGVSPAFADGNGAADPALLALVDEFWPDLPKTLPPTSVFPEGQVWLFRDPTGLSVAFKGGYNDEHHNHNDLGSYYVVADGRFVAGDPGAEEYTARTFGPDRYVSKVLNSYGHPVPVVGGKLQGTGRKFAAKVVETKVKVEGEGEQGSVVILDLTAGYDVKTLKKLTRTFVYDRGAKTFTVRDRAEFSEPTAFEDCTVTFGDKSKLRVEVEGKGMRRGEVVKLVEKPEEVIENPNRPSPHRFAWAFESPVTEAEVEFTFKSE